MDQFDVHEYSRRLAFRMRDDIGLNSEVLPEAELWRFRDAAGANTGHGLPYRKRLVSGIGRWMVSLGTRLMN